MRPNNNADCTGTCLIGHVVVSPAELSKVLGTGMESDGYKNSRVYLFETARGNVVTLYDWKATRLYDEDPRLPLPEDFWAQTEPVRLNVGGIPMESETATAKMLDELVHYLSYCGVRVHNYCLAR